MASVFAVHTLTMNERRREKRKNLVPKSRCSSIDRTEFGIHMSPDYLSHNFSIGLEVAEGYDSHNNSKAEVHIFVPHHICLYSSMQ